jgi:hypothetical protein
MRVGKIFVPLIHNEIPYMIAMVITDVGLRNDYIFKCDTVNSESTLAKNKYYHLSFTHLLGFINLYYEYITQTKSSLNANAQ